MNCATCGKKIDKAGISAADKDFCSDVCHLRFWKEEMPNLGGRWIEEEDIQKIEKLTGQSRKEEYDRVVNFIMGNFDLTSFMLNLRHGKKPDEDRKS